MTSFRKTTLLLGLFLILNLALAAPSSTKDIARCSRKECLSPTKFRYTPGNTYTYRYEADVASSIDSTAGGDESRLHMTAKVHLEVHSPCDWVLKVNDVSLQDSEPSDATRKTAVSSEAAFKQAVEQHEMAFTFDDGQVSHICPSPDEKAWVVNVKRGILSTLQNTMARFDLDLRTVETDVAGTCDVTYSFNGAEANSVKVLKTRDLASCSHRYGFFNSISAVSYRFLGESADSLQLTNSTSSCEQKITGYRITRVDCDEKHVVRPFAHDGAGAFTSVRQSLEFIEDVPLDEEHDDSTQQTTPAKASLLFQHSRHRDSLTVSDLATTLQKLCQHTEGGVEVEAAAIFESLANILRTMDKSSLSAFISDADAVCRDGEAARRLLIDGLITVATSDAISILVDEVKTGRLEQNLMNRWVASLAFIPRPTEKHLAAVMPLLDIAPPSRSANVALGISSMARKISKKGRSSETAILVNKLSRYLGTSCQTRSREEREDAVVALKSLANVGDGVHGDHLSIVKSCALEKDNPAEIRVGALQTLRNVPCNAEVQTPMEIFKDNTEDSEVRIAAYIAAMRCPSYQRILDVKDVLQREEVNQVGSFVWTHLRNMASSSLPSKLDLQALILDQELVKKFNLDARKFSRNYETSILFDKYSAALGLESNVIFSQQSYLPRSASLNLTVDIFGQSVNIFEIDGRFEGFERYIESLFGPGGVYHQKEIGHVLKSLRSKRKTQSVGLSASKLEAIDKQFDAKSRFDDEPELSIGTKFMGNDISYSHFEGHKEIAMAMQQMNPIAKLQKMLNTEETHFSLASQYIDATNAIPLSVGLPLNLAVRGHVVADVRGALNTELKSLFLSGKGDVTWKLHPSAAVSFDASMSVDAGVASAGVKLAATLHTSMSTSGKIAIDGLRLIDFQIDLPREKGEFLSVKSELLLQHRNTKAQIAGLIENREEMSQCTRGPTQRYLGLQLCTQISYPNTSEAEYGPFFPLTGPARLSVKLVKMDPAITTYRFLHKIDVTDKARSWTFTFTPEGSKSAKEMGLKTKLEHNKSDAGLFNFNLMLPSNTYEAKGNFNWGDDSKLIEASFLKDKNQEILVAKGSLNQNTRAKQQVYQPKLVLTLNNKNLVDLNGEMKLLEKKGIVKYDVDLQAKMGAWITGTKGYFLLDEKSQISNLTVEYKANPKARSEKIKIEVKVNNGSSQNLRQHDVQLTVEPSAYPNRNFMGSWRIEQGADHVGNVLTFHSGSAPRTLENALTIRQKFAYAAGPAQQDVKFKNQIEVSLPARNIDFAFVVGHEQTDFATDTLFVARYAPEKEARLGLMLNKQPGVLIKVDGSMNLTLPGQPIITVETSVQEDSKDHYKIDMNGLLGRETDFKLTGTYIDIVKALVASQDLKLNVIGTTILPIELAFSRQLNQTIYDMQLQSSYGKDAIMLHFAKENPTLEEVKFTSKIGYLAFVHSVESYWKSQTDGYKGTLDVHVDKVLDIRSDFSSDIGANGRRDTSLDFRWDANRNPLQKITMKITYEPSELSKNDWNSGIHVTYPGSFIKANAEALTRKNNRTITGKIDLSGSKLITFSSDTMRMRGVLSTELEVLTPYDSWKKNKFTFITQTKSKLHKTELRAAMGDQHFIDGLVLAEIGQSNDAKSAEATVSVSSSFDKFERFAIGAKTELTSKSLNSSLRAQWAKDQELAANSNFEWSFDGQVLMKSETSFATPFPQIGQAKFELYHNTEWEPSHVSETKGSLTINDQLYSILLKGESPSGRNRWEVTGMLATPHPRYSRIGLSTLYSGDETRPIFDLNLSWPEKQVALLLASEVLNEGKRAFAHVKTPFEELQHLAVDTFYSTPFDRDTFKFDVGTRWNAGEFATLNASWVMESKVNASLNIDLRTSFEEHDRYGTQLSLEVVEFLDFPSVKSVMRIAMPNATAIGIAMNCSMTKADTDGSVTAGSLLVEVAQYAHIHLEINHEVKANGHMKTNVLCGVDEKSASVDLETTTTEEGHLIGSLKTRLPIDSLNSADVKARFSKEYLNDPSTEFLAELMMKWKEFNQEKKAGLRLNYLEVLEELEDFSQRSTTTFEANVRSPWSPLQRLGMKGKQTAHGANMEHSIEALFNEQTFSLNGSADFLGQEATMLFTRKYPGQQKPFNARMNTTWDVMDEQIQVSGSVSTSLPGFSRIPWKITVTVRDNEEDENDWERQIQGEAQFTKTQFLYVSATYLPAKLSADMVTPFDAFKVVNLTVDYERPSEWSVSGAAELRINDDLVEVNASYDWPEDNTLPLELQFSVSSPFKYEVALLSWKTEDPSSAAEFSASLKGRPLSVSTEGRYSFASVENFNAQFKIEKSVDEQVDAGEVGVTVEITPDAIASALSVATPFDALKKLDSSLAVMYEVKHFKTALALESELLSGRVHALFEGDSDNPNADLQIKLDELGHLAVKTSTDTEYNKVDLTASVSWDREQSKWEVQSQFRRDEWSKYDWRTDVTSGDSDKWLLIVDLDFKDIAELYRHNISFTAVHRDVTYGTFGSLLTQDDAYLGTLGADVGSVKPVQLRFVNKKLARKVGNMMIEITSPWTEEPSLIVDVDIDDRSVPFLVKVTATAAERAVYLGTDVKFRSLTSMSAHSKLKTTLSWLPDASFDFNVHGTHSSFNGSYALGWSDSNVDLYVFHEELDSKSLLREKNIHGAVQLKTSWERVPEASVRYSKDFATPTACDTLVTVSHNSTEMVNVLYKSNERSSAGHDASEGTVEVRGALLTGAIAFSRDFKYSAGNDGDNLPRSLTRALEVYKLADRAKYLMKAELSEKETLTGREYAVELSSPVRTIRFSTHTDAPDGIFKHGSEFRWRPDDRIAYEIEIENKTSAAAIDYVMTTSLITPVRDIGLTGTIRQTKRNLRAVGELLWDLKRRESLARVALTWENATKTPEVASHKMRLGFSQGTLPQELVLLAQVQRSKEHLVTMNGKIQYSNDARQHVDMNAELTASNGVYRGDLNVTHPSTGLELREVTLIELNGSGRVQVSDVITYSRTAVEPRALEHLFIFDPVDGKVLYSASSPAFTLRHQGQLIKTGNQSKLTYEIQQDDFSPRAAELDFDHSLPYGRLTVNYDPEKLQALHLKGGMLDKRQAIVELVSMTDKDFEPLFDFAFRLNHSHLITSHARWPLDYRSRVLAGARRVRESIRQTGAQWNEAFATQPFNELSESSRIIAEEVLQVLDIAWLNFVGEVDKLKADVGTMRQNVIDGYNANAFYAKLAVDIGGAIVRDIPFDSYAQNFVSFVERTGNRILDPLTGEENSFSEWLRSVSQSLSTIAESVGAWLGKQWDWPSDNTSKALSQLADIFRQMAREYDRFMEQLQTSVTETFRGFRTPLRNLLRDSWTGIYDNVRPLVLRAAMEIEDACWNVMKEVLDYFYEQRDVVVKSNYFQKLALLVEDVKQFYVDMQSIDWPSNVQKYLKKCALFLQQKYADIDDYLLWLEALKAEWSAIYQAFLAENPEVQKGIEDGERVVAFLRWSYGYLQVNQKIPQLVSAVREHGLETLRQTATEARMRHRVQKTKLRMHPELGFIELEQKLPFPWLSLDQRPQFEELPELQRVRSFVRMFQSSNSSAVDELMSYLPRETRLFDLLPPFKSSAHLFGLQHFKTFDGKHYEFVGPCTYLLSRDLVTRNYTLAVQYASSRGKPYAAVLKLVLDEVQWDLDLANQTVRMAGVGQTLPASHGLTSAHYEAGKFVIESRARGVRLECIASYEACTFTVSGWYNNKVGGMLGTMDHEPSNDLVLPNHIVELDLPSLARSWDVSPRDDCRTPENLAKKIVPADEKQVESCNALFFGARSVLRHCHSAADPAPYARMCATKPRKAGIQEGCHAAAAYVEACAAVGVSVRMPPQCIRCQIENEFLSEGEVKEFVQDKTHKASSDVVLILETKKCNEPDVQSRRFLASLATSLEQELNQQKIIKNRFSLVTFGGAGAFDSPKVRTVHGQEFVSAKEMQNLLANVQYDDGGSTRPTDALRFASQLNFRPGVSKTFILISCSACGESQGHRLSAQSLADRDISLHFLTDAEFRFNKPNASRQFLGLDARTGYTPKEIKGRLVGDADLRRLAKLPRSAVGVCASLALETNGTIFSVRRLREQASQSKRAVNIWAKRVASTGAPSDCQKCFCSVKNYYQSGLDCRSCAGRDVRVVDTSFLVDDATISRIGKSVRSRGKDDEPAQIEAVGEP